MRQNYIVYNGINRTNATKEIWQVELRAAAAECESYKNYCSVINPLGVLPVKDLNTRIKCDWSA